MNRNHAQQVTLGGLAGLALVVPLAVSAPVAAGEGPPSTTGASTTAAVAQAPRAKPRIVSPADGALIRHRNARVCVRGLAGSSAMVGSKDVTSRFHRSRRGVRCAILRRGREARLGTNRLVIESGTASVPRYTAREFVLGKRRHVLLQLRERHNSPAPLRVRVHGPRKPFEYVQIRLNGKRVRTSDWAVGDRTPSTEWPLAARDFDAAFGADDNLRHGKNRLTMTAWRADGTYDRDHLTTRVRRPTPLVSAGDGARVPAGREVRLDGSETIGPRPANGRRVHLRWEIADSPAGSEARLKKAGSRRARLVTDVHGTYRIRLTARASRSRHKARSARTASDSVTVEATPAVPPIGAPVTTINDDGGITVGGTSYPASAGSWAQLLVLDRHTLELVDNQRFGDTDAVTMSDVDDLVSTLEDYDPSHLVLLAGGGRAAEVGPEVYTAVSEMFAAAGGSSAPGDDVLDDGAWSLIGVPGVDDSAHQNLFGMIYGASAGAGSQPGALTGYLREDAFDNYGFASADVATIDTQVSGAPAGVNEIRVGSQTYTSDQLPAGYSGFHVLVLDSMLNKTDERTYGIDGVGKEPVDTKAADKMRQFLNSLDTPGYTVIIQSIGAPFGWQTVWVNDGTLVRNTFGTDPNKVVPRAPSTWYDAEGIGQSLASAVGGLGGVLAHDQFAQLNTLNTPEGYTLIASTGQMDYDGDATTDEVPTPVDPMSTPTSIVSSDPNAGVTGTLSRDREALWKIETPASEDGFDTGALQEVLYQSPTAWPMSSDADHRAANCYIASQLFEDTHITDVRVAYYEKATSDWDSVRTTMLEMPAWTSGLACPSTGDTFTETAYSDMRTQLAEEMLKVSSVANLTDQWTRIFGNETTDGYIDMQTIAGGIVNNINEIDSSDQSTIHTEKIVGDSLKIAGALSFAVPGAGAAFGGLSGAVDLVADTSSDSTGAPSLAPLDAELSALGEGLVDRYQTVGSNLEQIEAILVSDSGKLQRASGLSASLLPDPAQVLATLRTSSKQQVYTALLPTVYGLYYVPSNYIQDDAVAPWDLACKDDNEWNPGATHPFGTTNDTPDAWTYPVIQTAVGPEALVTYLGMATKADIDDDGTMVHNSHQPRLANMAADATSNKPGDNLFEALSTDSETALGMDPTTLYADPAFTTRWFWCNSDYDG